MPTSELREKHLASRRERAVEKRREQEGTVGQHAPKRSRTW
ncbi:hypothetical protein [Streptomyces bathyalis]|nr:hypothetical protein [Streptomyces bathyalis]